MFSIFSSRRFVRSALTITGAVMAMVLMAVVATACSDQGPLMAATPETASLTTAPQLVNDPPPPIAVEALTARHEFTDDIAVQVRVKPDGRSTEAINLRDASNIAVLRFTVQPGARFPWHSHPGLVMVSITQGDLVFITPTTASNVHTPRERRSSIRASATSTTPTTRRRARRSSSRRCSVCRPRVR